MNKLTYTLYCDLDGVFVDLVKRSHQLFGITPRGHLSPQDIQAEQQFWNCVRDLYATGQEFWRDMDPLPDAHTLWQYVSQYNPTILTSRGKIPQGAAEKRDWVSRHLSDTVDVIVVDSGKKKALYATPTAILVDDTVHVVDRWIASGGIGILHTSAECTISQLREILKEA